MFTDTAPTEYVYHISNEEQRQILQDHFNLFYQFLADSRLVPNACYESVEGAQRCLSGIPLPTFNAVLGSINTNRDLDECIEEQMGYFQTAKLPFVWYVDENGNQELKQRLIQHGFENEGVFQGVIGFLNHPMPATEIPNDCTLELVQDEKTLDEFNELVSATFGINGPNKDLFKTVLSQKANNAEPKMFHWLARKQGKVVAALSTLIEGHIVSFWNGATSFENRHSGLCTALSRLAIQDAMSRGCEIGISYLMSDALAMGISQQLGGEIQWRFNIFLAPLNTHEQAENK